MKSLTKKIFITIITGIIIIVLGAWGMGDLFSTGNKNVIAEVGDKKVYIKDYLNYARLYLRKKNYNQLLKQDHDIILNNLISEKIYEKFAEDLKIKINDKSLAFFIKNDKNFKDENGKFSRVEYEKYLLLNNLNPKTVENFYKRELIKKISIEVFINGINDTKYHKSKLKNDFLKQVEIKYYNLNILNKVSEKEINEYYNKNQDRFSLGEMRSGRYANLNYLNLGFKEENDVYYQTINNIENDLINNVSFNDIIKKYRLKTKSIEKINKNGINQSRIKSSQDYFSKAIFKLNKNFNTEMLNVNNSKYLIKLDIVEKEQNLKLNDQIKKEIIKIINLQKNQQLSEKIKKSQNSKSFFNYAKNNNIIIKEIFFTNILDNKKIFNKKNMEKIFSTNINNNLTFLQDGKVYIVRIEKISKNKNKINNLDKAVSDQVKQDFKALVLRDLDKYLLKKYPVKLNNKVFDQVKRSI
tara:strand:- start:938 stop:2341 length:1404 start_codon:yes stop_codon:yes gene_type:complete